MGKPLRPIEGIERIDNLWSWIERWGVIKALVTAVLGAGITTSAVAMFQRIPRSVVLSLVFVFSVVLILLLIALMLWARDEIKKKIKGVIEAPLLNRVTALEKSVEPRRIDPEQRIFLQEEMAKGHGRIRIIAIGHDDDAVRFAEDFAEVLRAAGWDIWGIDRQYDYGHPFNYWGPIGLYLLTNHQALQPYPPAQKLAETLKTAGIKCTYCVNYELNYECCELAVGHRGEAP